MIEIVAIGSPKAECVNCHEAIKRLKTYLESKDKDKYTFEVLMSNDEKAKKYGMISTPTIIVNNEVLSLGKAVSMEDVEEMFASYDL
ncbi:thioredoxin family protein [Candidatus Riflebacteria bacterium]